MTYCKIVKATKESSYLGGEHWVLVHECGKVERRTARRRNSRSTKPAPTRVKCDGAGHPPGAGQ
jgi:hypothetical protein